LGLSPPVSERGERCARRTPALTLRGIGALRALQFELEGQLHEELTTAAQALFRCSLLFFSLEKRMWVLRHWDVLSFIGNSLMNTFLIYLGMRWERWNVQRKAEKDAAAKWYESQGDRKDPTV